MVTLEHRYYGQSSPFRSLTTKNLQYLSSNQALYDLAVFRQYYQASSIHSNTRYVVFVFFVVAVSLHRVQIKYMQFFSLDTISSTKDLIFFNASASEVNRSRWRKAITSYISVVSLTSGLCSLHELTHHMFVNTHTHVYVYVYVYASLWSFRSEFIARHVSNSIIISDICLDGIPLCIS